MEGRADLRDAEALAGKILDAAETLFIGRVGDQQRISLEAFRLLALGRDDLQLALTGEVVEATGEGGDAVVHVAGHDSHRNGLRRLEIFQVDLDALILEVAALDGEDQYYLRLAYSGVSTAQIQEGLGKLRALIESHT